MNKIGTVPWGTYNLAEENFPVLSSPWLRLRCVQLTAMVWNKADLGPSVGLAIYQIGDLGQVTEISRPQLPSPSK